jgi:hypothetical protein
VFSSELTPLATLPHLTSLAIFVSEFTPLATLPQLTVGVLDRQPTKGSTRGR